MDSAAPNSSSSSTALWATATREWVIPAKPKPGRKPKKDTQAVVNDVEEIQSDSKGRRVQNRAAQRAFRERKQSQLAELQARVQLYEQGEIERNIALQNVAKRLKEENERLRTENASLKDRVATLEKLQKQQQEQPKKRWGEPLPVHVPEKKIKLASVGPFSPAQIHIFETSPNSPSPPSMASSPESSCDSDRFSFDPSPEPTAAPCGLGMLVDLSSSSSSTKDGHGIASTRSSIGISDTPIIYGNTFDCGFCNEDTPCVCREIAMQEQQAALGSGIKDEDFPPPIMSGSHAPTTIVLPDPEQQPTLSPRKKSQHKSILDNLPPYQPAVPLRRGVGRTKSGKSIFKISPAASAPSCSGDPTDCPACSDDTFGRAFCSAIGESVATLPPCEDCPSNTCYGGPASAASTDRPSDRGVISSFDAPMPTFPAQSDPFSSSSPSTIALPTSASRSQLIPTNDAWAQIKAHPHASFADLQMLADVVARKSKCTGPRISLSPHPEIEDAMVDDTPVLLTDPHAVFKGRDSMGPEESSERSSSDPTVISIGQREQSCCGRRRVRQVEADAVQDALRMLDAKYGSSSS